MRRHDRGARTGQADDFLDQFIDIDGEQLLGFGARAVELAHAGDDLGDVFAATFDGLQIAALRIR